MTSPGDDGGGRRPADEGEAAPTLGVVDGLEQEARTVAYKAPKSADRGQIVGYELAPDRHDGVGAGELAESRELVGVLRAFPDERGTRPKIRSCAAHEASPKLRWKQLQSPV